MKHWKTKILLQFTIALLLAVGVAETESITLTDKLGRVVTIRVPVSRAVIFQTYEFIPALGIWDNVVGIGRHAYDNDLIKATKPDVADVIPSPGSGDDINIEALLKLKPELVITWTYKPDSVRFIEEKGITVLGVSPESLSEFYGAVRIHGRLFGKEAKAEACIAEMEKVFSLVKERVSSIRPEARRKVLWLLGKPTTVACAQAVSSNLIKLMGGMNPAATIRQTSLDVSMEQIVAWNPDVIFIWGYAGYTAESILGNTQWWSVTAVKQGNVFKAPLWSTWSPRVAPIVLWMAMKTYPESFPDVD
ncbi:MAG: ABC transporter substrate-binding protein, partial [Desulfomonilaceae bacterium]